MVEAAFPLTFTELPAGYRQTTEFNLRNNTRMMIILNVVGFGLFLVAAALLPVYLRQVRPLDFDVVLSFEVDNFGQLGLFLLFMAVDFILLVILHEGVHGLCFRLITGKRAIYAIGPGYAYAAAPDIFITRKPYLITAISPLIVLTILGMMVIPLVPRDILFHVGLIIVLNIAGAVGDLWVVGGLVFKRDPLLVQDSGDRVVIFQQEGNLL
jgi:hypothetical protein